jgi:two-component system sensor histidine kinase BarA
MKWGIKHQVLLLALVPTISVSVLLSTYFIATRLQDLEEMFRSQGKALALQLITTAEYGVFTRNKEYLLKLAHQTQQEHHSASDYHLHTINGLAFYAPSGEEIVVDGTFSQPFQIPTESERKKTPMMVQENLNSMIFTTPITIAKEVSDTHSDFAQAETLIGWLRIELETQHIHLRQMKNLLHSIFIFLFGLGISSYYALRMGKKVTEPISALAGAVERIKQGELQTRVNVSTYAELEVLGSGINTMAEALANAHHELQHKIDQATLSLRRTLETIEVQNIELDIAKRAAETASKVKSEFLADMSHEIRTPLNGVIGFVNLLNRSELNTKQREYINTIQKTSSNLLAILNDILDFSKIEAGKLRIEYAPMDVRDCIDETLALFASHAHEKNILLVPLVYSDVPKRMLGDALRIKQIITNLVSNAIKFTDEGSIIIRAMLEHEAFSHFTIRLSVTDTGIGLSPEEQHALFQAFNQSNVHSSHRGGTGLGLAICKKLAVQMGGSIGVESEAQKGATFWFTFKAEKYTPDSTLISHQTTALTPAPTTLAPAHILIVDDNLENLKLLKLLLEDLKMHVTTAEDGSDAIDLYQKQSFQLILMDLRMPGINGIEASQKIRALEADSHQEKVPIVALTAHVFDNEKETLLAVGIDDYLTKPINEPELIRILRQWIKPMNEQPTASVPLIIDWELGKKLAGNRLELAIEFLEKLTETLPEEKLKINAAVLEKNWETLRDISHRLHGACAYCGVPILKAAVHDLEVATDSKTLTTITPCLEAFNQAVDAVLTLMKSEALNKRNPPV